MVKKMVSNRIQRVYADYLKNSWFSVMSLDSLPMSHSYSNMPLFGHDGKGAPGSWRWLSFCVLGWSEHGGEHHLRIKQPTVVAFSFDDEQNSRVFPGEMAFVLVLFHY